MALGHLGAGLEQDSVSSVPGRLSGKTFPPGATGSAGTSSPPDCSEPPPPVPVPQAPWTLGIPLPFPLGGSWPWPRGSFCAFGASLARELRKSQSHRLCCSCSTGRAGGCRPHT